jgi:Sec-independent protein translocase protein TatA
MEVLAVLTILLILFLALVIFGPRKLLHVATNVVPTGHPLEKLMSLMTGSADADIQEVGSLRESSTELPKRVAARSGPLPSLTAGIDSE